MDATSGLPERRGRRANPLDPALKPAVSAFTQAVRDDLLEPLKRAGFSLRRLSEAMGPGYSLTTLHRLNSGTVPRREVLRGLLDAAGHLLEHPLRPEVQQLLLTSYYQALEVTSPDLRRFYLALDERDEALQRCTELDLALGHLTEQYEELRSARRLLEEARNQRDQLERKVRELRDDLLVAQQELAERESRLVDLYAERSALVDEQARHHSRQLALDEADTVVTDALAAMQSELDTRRLTALPRPRTGDDSPPGTTTNTQVALVERAEDPDVPAKARRRVPGGTAGRLVLRELVTDPLRRLDVSVASDRSQLRLPLEEELLRDPRVVEIRITSTGRRDIPTTAFHQGRPLVVELGIRIVRRLDSTAPGSATVPVEVTDTAVVIGPGQFRKDHPLSIRLLVDGPAPTLAVDDTALTDVAVRSIGLQEQRQMEVMQTVLGTVILAGLPLQWLGGEWPVVGIVAVVAALIAMGALLEAKERVKKRQR